jgi:hypothetical protein
MNTSHRSALPTAEGLPLVVGYLAALGMTAFSTSNAAM